jgi:hypothetical protein
MYSIGLHLAVPTEQASSGSSYVGPRRNGSPRYRVVRVSSHFKTIKCVLRTELQKVTVSRGHGMAGRGQLLRNVRSLAAGAQHLDEGRSFVGRRFFGWKRLTLVRTVE